MIDDLSGIGLHTDEPLTEKLRITAEEVFDAEEDGCMDDLDGVTVAGLLTAARNEIIALRTMIEGRTTAPTREEFAAVRDAGGAVRFAYPIVPGEDATVRGRCFRYGDVDDARDMGATAWWAFDRTGRLCTWPVAGGAR